jgi:hypothetical protein
MAELYKCTNKACIMGEPNQPAYFTDGMTQAQKSLKTGMPLEQMEEGTDYGEGICPECGKPGTLVGEEFESLVGDDPYEELHQGAKAQVQGELEQLRERYEAGDVTDEELADQRIKISDEAQQAVIEGVEASDSTG